MPSMLAVLEEDVLPLGTQDIEVLRTSQPRRGLLVVVEVWRGSRSW